MGEPVVYVPVDDAEALDALEQAIGVVPHASDVLDQLRSMGYALCRAEP